MSKLLRHSYIVGPS